MTTKKLLTVGELARQLGVPIHKVEYLLGSRKIKPTGRAGNLRVFDKSVLHRIQDEIRERNDHACAGST